MTLAEDQDVTANTSTPKASAFAGYRPKCNHANVQSSDGIFTPISSFDHQLSLESVHLLIFPRRAKSMFCGTVHPSSGRFKMEKIKPGCRSYESYSLNDFDFAHRGPSQQ